MTADEDDEVYDALPVEERRRVLQQHLNDMVAWGELIAEVGADGKTRYFTPENYVGRELTQ